MKIALGHIDANWCDMLPDMSERRVDGSSESLINLDLESGVSNALSWRWTTRRLPRDIKPMLSCWRKLSSVDLDDRP